MAKIQVNKISSLVNVTESPTSVTVQRKSPQVIEVISQGPQGPAFAGTSLLNTAAMAALTSGDVGTVLEFDGTQFSPTNELENDLTITGGNF